MQDSDEADRPQRRSALVAQKLARSRGGALFCDVLHTSIMTSADSNADHRPTVRKRGVQVLETNRLLARKI